MEFIVANFKFRKSKNLFKNIYYEANVEPKLGSEVLFYDGYLVDERYNSFDCFTQLENWNGSVQGLYNVICCDSEKEIISILNDKEGRVPLFYYYKEGKIALSNNVWTIVEILRDEIEIDLDSLKAQTVYYTDVIPERTLFKGVKKINPATRMDFTFEGIKISEKTYTLFTYNPNFNLSPDDVVDKVDEALTKLFKVIKRDNPNKVMGFGNSGGFDSRLMAYYAHKSGIDTTGFVVCEKKPNFALSTTALLSQKVADLYGIPNKIVEPTPVNLLKYVLLDIRNNPFSSSEFFKNHYDKIGVFDYEITGQPGALCYVFTPNVYDKSFDMLVDYSHSFLDNTSMALDKYDFTRLRIMKHLGLLKQKAKRMDKWNRRSLIFNVGINLEEKSRYEELVQTLTILRGNNNVETYIRLHDFVTNKYVFSGGYESVSRTKKSYYLYSNYFYGIVKELPFEYFVSRKLLKMLFQKNDYRLGNILGQDLQHANKKGSSIVKKIEMAVRGRGMNPFKLLKTREYQEIVAKVLSRDNDIFNSVFDVRKLKKSSILFTYAGMDIVKLKFILDIYLNKEFDLLKNKDFEIVN